MPVSSLENKRVGVWGFDGWKWATVVKNKDQANAVVKITSTNGLTVDCDRYDNIFLEDDSKVEVRELCRGSKLKIPDYPVLDGERLMSSDPYTAGFFAGDGWVASRGGYTFIALYGVKRGLLHYITPIKNVHDDGVRLTVRIDCNYERDFVPLYMYTVNTKLKWLAGLIDSDGTKHDKAGSISISSVNYPFLYKVQRLLETLNIKSSIKMSKEKCKQMMPDGKGGKKEYDCKVCYRIYIPPYQVHKLWNCGLRTHRVPVRNTPVREILGHVYVDDKSEYLTMGIDTFRLDNTKVNRFVINGLSMGI
jgi:ribonucleoside-diphosphate reductase alpha chain